MRIRWSCRQSDAFVLAIISQTDQKAPFQPRRSEKGGATQETRVTKLRRQQMVGGACGEEQDRDLHESQQPPTAVVEPWLCFTSVHLCCLRGNQCDFCSSAARQEPLCCPSCGSFTCYMRARWARVLAVLGKCACQHAALLLLLSILYCVSLHQL